MCSQVPAESITCCALRGGARCSAASGARGSDNMADYVRNNRIDAVVCAVGTRGSGYLQK